MPSRPVPGTTEPGKFGRLFAEARLALLAGTHQLQSAPADNGPRWGISAVLRPDPRAARAIEQIAVTAAGVVGDGHWMAGAAASSQELVAEEVGRQRGDSRADVMTCLAAFRGALEDRRHDAGADVENLVLEAGEQLGVGKVVAEEAVDRARAGQAGSGAGRRASRIPRWLVEVSMAWAMRAAGR